MMKLACPKPHKKAVDQRPQCVVLECVRANLAIRQRRTQAATLGRLHRSDLQCERRQQTFQQCSGRLIVRLAGGGRTHQCCVLFARKARQVYRLGHSGTPSFPMNRRLKLDPGIFTETMESASHLFGPEFPIGAHRDIITILPFQDSTGRWSGQRGGTAFDADPQANLQRPNGRHPDRLIRFPKTTAHSCSDWDRFSVAPARAGNIHLCQMASANQPLMPLPPPQRL